jgi:TatD DNase family protein
MRLIDSHCHIDSREYDGDRDEVVRRAKEAGLEHMVLVGLWREGEGVASAQRALDVAATDPALFSPTVCIHPHDVAAAPEADFQAIEALCRKPEVVAVGETGLDYHYDHSPRDAQQLGFRRFIRLAHETAKPLVVHTREAEADTYRCLDEEGVPARGAVIHCFTGDRAAAREYLARGLYISFSGISTFRTAEELREAAKLVPLDRLLVETDAPFLAPLPHRGKRNEPAWVARTVEVLAAVKGVSPEVLAEATADNARRFFGLGERR